MIGQVSITASQKKCKLMTSTSISNSKSFSKASARQGVGHLREQRLVVRFTPTQGIEANDVALKVNLATHQPVTPLLINRESAPQQRRFPSLCGATQEDEPTIRVRSRVGLEVESPLGWKGS